jgi:hypothetical protein
VHRIVVTRAARTLDAERVTKLRAGPPPRSYNLNEMPILLVLLGLLAPRITLVIAGCAGAFNGVWQSLLWPVLGFLFLPYTTLAYGIAMAYGGGVQGVWLVLLIVGVVLDLGTSGESARRGGKWRRAS